MLTIPLFSQQSIPLEGLLKRYEERLAQAGYCIDAVSSTGSFSLVSYAVDDRREEAQVYTKLYCFSYDGPGKVSPISTGLGYISDWVKGSAETPCNLAFYFVWNSRIPVCTISVYNADELTYDAAGAERHSLGK